MSVNKLVSIRNPIVDAQMALDIDHDKDIPIFTRWATLAEKEIGSYNQYERTKAVLNIKGCVANLPNDCVMVELGIMGDHGTDCDNLFNVGCGITSNVTNVNSNGLFLVVDIYDYNNGSYNWGYVDFNIQNNKIIFDRGCVSEHITIQYLKYKTDCDGFMEIGENHVNAIKWFIMYNYSLRKMSKSGNYIDRDLMRLYREEWNRECAHARAQDNELTSSQRKRVVNLWHNPWAGKGMWQGMYGSLGNAYNIW